MINLAIKWSTQHCNLIDEYISLPAYNFFKNNYPKLVGSNDWYYMMGSGIIESIDNYDFHRLIPLTKPFNFYNFDVNELIN